MISGPATFRLGLIVGAHTTAACTAIVSSLAVNFAIKAFGITIPLNIDSGAVALLVSIVLFVSVSLFGSRPNISPQHLTPTSHPNISLGAGSRSDKWAE